MARLMMIASRCCPGTGGPEGDRPKRGRESESHWAPSLATALTRSGRGAEQRDVERSVKQDAMQVQKSKRCLMAEAHRVRIFWHSSLLPS